MKQKRKGIRGISASSAAMGVFLAAVLLLFAVSALGASLTEPADPLSASVSAAVNDAPRLCDSEENERVYIPTPVASGQSEEEKREQTDEAVSPEEEEPPPEEEEQEPEPEREEPKQRPETRAERENSLPGRSGSSGESGTPSSAGGIGGGENENGKKTDEVYFTTTIKDGETVTDPAYAFSVRHLKEELTVKKMTVSVNGEAVNQFNGAVALSEGKNVIRVKVDYADSGGKTVASPFKDYTVYLDTRSLVIQTSLKDETVTKDQYPFTASASYQGEEVPLSVTFNGETVSGTGGKYRVRLKEGTNLFVLSAKGGGLKKENQYTIVYQSDGIFDFETDLADSLVVTEPMVSFSVWMVNGADAKFTVKHGGKKISGESEERFTVNDLTYGENTITITARSGDQNVSRDYTVTFARPEASDDNPVPDPSHAPTVTTDPDLNQRITTNNASFTLNVWGADYRGNRLTAENMRLYLNGAEVRSDFQTATSTTYVLKLTEAVNTVKIFLKDNEGYTAIYSYELGYERTEGPIGQALVSVEAPTLGLGYIIPPTPCDIYSAEPASYVIERFFAEQGMSTHYTGDLDNNYFLNRIYKPGITNGFRIPENLVTYLEDYGASDNGNYDENSLGSMDFYGLSGWCVAINEDYPGYSFADINLRDGDRLQIRYTLHNGMDIGAGGNYGAFPEVFKEPY